MDISEKVRKKIYNTIKSGELLNEGERVLVGLSGGADSVCLTHALYSMREELGIQLFTAHLNHGLRGTEAERDAGEAKRFSETLGIECTLETADMRAYAKKNGISEETAGRELRYDFFERIAKEKNIDKIATAHNRNDNAETIVMNFIRGSGLSGLCGIPKRRGNIIRPLLNVSRTEIEEYCRAEGLSYVTDSTNLTDDYTRNKIRHILLPEIEKFNPNFIETVTKNADLIADDDAFIARTAEKEYAENVSGGSINIDALEKLDISVKRRVIRKMISEIRSGRDLSADYIADVIALAEKNRTGSMLNLPDGVQARIEYGKLIIELTKHETDSFEYRLEIGKETYIPEMGIIIKAEKTEKSGKLCFAAGENAEIAVRSRRAGEVFYPEGMSGKKKIKDYFINEKIPRAERPKTGLLTIDGEIAYIIGKRRDRRFKFDGSGIKITIK